MMSVSEDVSMLFIETMNVFPVVVGGYVATSYFFLRNPHLLHKIKKFSPAKIIAHRGGAAEG